MLLATLALTEPANAQGVTAQQRQAAAEAYDRGTAAYLARDFAAAAQWFEAAHRLAPAAAALEQAIRSHQRAGNDMRAADLALRLKALYPDSQSSQALANEVLPQAQQRYVRVVIICEHCQAQLDGTLVDHDSFFIEPNTEHTVTGAFGTGEVSEQVRGRPGQTRELRFTAPPPPPGVEVGPDGQIIQPPPEVQDESRGLPMAAFIAAGAATLVVGGIATWYGVDTLNAGHAWNDRARTLMTTCASSPGLTECLDLQADYDDGQKRETISTVLVGAAGALAVTSVILAILTDWKGSPDSDEEDIEDVEDEDLDVEEDVEDEEVARAPSHRGQAFQVSANLNREGGMFVLGGRF